VVCKNFGVAIVFFNYRIARYNIKEIAVGIFCKKNT
jgi:hypothetical protein